MKLVIIEGAGKKETIEKYLGAGYRVFATKGHIIDLPPKSLAVDIKNNFEPRYEAIADKKEIINSMKKAAAAADEVFLATDPDREGEAISWHVANALKIPPQKKARIVFNEISKKAVNDALAAPRAIDIPLVDAQQARRVLDRLVGYKVSPFLCKKIQNKLSAGRVQSVTLRLVVERDREIANFKPEEYWIFNSILNKDEIDFKANLALKGGKKYKISTADEVERVKSELDGKPYTVQSVKKSVVAARPSPPFITSSMQQDALNKLGMTLNQTSLAAQNLYEGVDLPGEGKVALITYIRTDSTRVSDDAIKEARAFITSKYGDKYTPAKPNIYASKKGAQDAHEAIRPITLDRTPESVKDKIQPNLYRLYKLIYERFLASQMSPAEYDALTVDIANGVYGFKVMGKTLIFPGFTAVYKAFEEEKEDENSPAKLPQLVEGETLKFIEYKYEQKFTKPPPHFTEASLVKSMEEKGIGRPATYVPTVAILFNRQYAKKEGKFIISTQLGGDVTDMLVKYFPDILDVKFTAEMEEKLDKIEDGGMVWQEVVSVFYEGLHKELLAAFGDKPPDEESEFTCPECNTQMVYRHGKFGKFLACSNYPKCKFTQPIDENGNPTERVKGDDSVEESEYTCQECGKQMVYRKGKFGRFLACSDYPKCRFTQHLDENGNIVEKPKDEESDVVCENCGKKMILKNGRYGKFLACPGYPKCKNIKNLEKSPSQNQAQSDEPPSGPCPECGKPTAKKRGRSVFYGCTGYPECKFTSSYRILEGKCPDCDSYLVYRTHKDIGYEVCAAACGYKKQLSETINSN